MEQDLKRHEERAFSEGERVLRWYFNDVEKRSKKYHRVNSQMVEDLNTDAIP